METATPGLQGIGLSPRLHHSGFLFYLSKLFATGKDELILSSKLKRHLFEFSFI